MIKQAIWERLVRRAYPAHEFARVLGRDTKQVRHWCQHGLPHSLEAIVDSVLERVPEKLFFGHTQLPDGWIRLAACDGGECTQRHWLPVRGAALTVRDAHLLDRLGYGVLMHRELRRAAPRQFALDFHLLHGCAADTAL